MSSPEITDDDRAAVLAVLQSPTLSMGPRTAEFEKAVAERVGRKHGVAVSSGTAGLHISLIAAGCRPGDMVITSPFSFIASANAILFCGGIPIFVDVERDTGNIDPRHVEACVENLVEKRHTAEEIPPRVNRHDLGALHGLLPVHAFGQPADMDAFIALSETHNLRIVEDSCEALGSRYKDRQAGALSDFGVFAFYPNKQITTGEGGMVVTDDDEAVEVLRSLRNQGRDVFDAWLNHSRLGYNYRLDEMSAALGVSQMSRLDDIVLRRQQVADWYSERLGAVSEVQIPTVGPATTLMSWFVYVVRLPDADTRSAVMAALEAERIPSRPYFSPIHLQPFYREKFGYEKGQFPVTEDLGNTCLALPFSAVMTEREVDHVSRSLGAFFS